MNPLESLYWWVNHGTTHQQRMEDYRRREVEALEEIADKAKRERERKSYDP